MTEMLMIAAIVAVVLLSVTVRTFVVARHRLRGVRLVDCPETRRPTLIALDFAALGTAAGTARLRVRDCARWPAHRDCGQPCLRQLTPEIAQRSVLLSRKWARPTD